MIVRLATDEDISIHRAWHGSGTGTMTATRTRTRTGPVPASPGYGSARVRVLAGKAAGHCDQWYIHIGGV